MKLKTQNWVKQSPAPSISHKLNILCCIFWERLSYLPLQEHMSYFLKIKIRNSNIRESRSLQLQWYGNKTCSALFEIIVGVLTTCHTQYTWDSNICNFLFNRTTLQVFVTYLFLQVSRNWRYESEPPLKPSQPTCYRQFGTNSIIMLMSVESQIVHIYSTCKVCNKNWGVLFY